MKPEQLSSAKRTGVEYLERFMKENGLNQQFFIRENLWLSIPHRSQRGVSAEVALKIEKFFKKNKTIKKWRSVGEAKKASDRTLAGWYQDVVKGSIVAADLRPDLFD